MNLLKKGNFLGTKAGTLILVHNEEWVGEQEEEQVAIIAMIKPESQKVFGRRKMNIFKEKK